MNLFSKMYPLSQQFTTATSFCGHPDEIPQAIHYFSTSRGSVQSNIEDPRWAAVQARDASTDQQFVYAVKTTGIYCRPGYSARLPKWENAEFFDTLEAAEAAGYRPEPACIRRSDRGGDAAYGPDCRSLPHDRYGRDCSQSGSMTAL